MDAGQPPGRAGFMERLAAKPSAERSPAAGAQEIQSLRPARALALATVLFLAGCAATSPVSPPAAIPSGRPAFELDGRIGVRDGEHSFFGNLHWRAGEGRDRLLLATPLGQGVARITRGAGATILQWPDGRSETAADPEDLLEKVLGFRLPLGGLDYWVEGRLDPHRPGAVVRNGEGRIERLSQDGWQVHYLAYAGARPARLRLRRDDIEVTLIVDRWGS